MYRKLFVILFFLLSVASTAFGDKAEAPLWKRELSAKRALQQVAWTEKQFFKLKLKLPARSLDHNLERMLVLLKDMEHAYDKAASYQGEETLLAVLYKKASAYRHLVTQIRTALADSEPNTIQKRHYFTAKEQTIIGPYWAKAITTVSQCVQNSSDLRILSAWTEQCYRLGYEIDPELFPARRTFYLEPVQLALILPSEEEATLRMGEVGNDQRAEMFSPLYDSETIDRTVAQIEPLDDIPPRPFNYEPFQKARITWLAKQIRSLETRESEGYSFAFLNVLRITDPQRALSLVTTELRKTPKDIPLKNILALTHVELRNYAMARKLWKQMVKEKVKSGAPLNNLGVLAYLEGREFEAVKLFKKAAWPEVSRQALSNLGMLALKYRNGSVARDHFEEALAFGQENTDAISQTGLLFAQLQNREFKPARVAAKKLVEYYVSEPYATLGVAYFLSQVDEDSEGARTLAKNFLESNNIENPTTAFTPLLVEVLVSKK